MAVGLPLKTTYANGDVYSASDVNDTNGTINAFLAPFAAGKNEIINGDFTINQRNFSSSTTDGVFGFDRWLMQSSGGCTYSAQTFTLGTAPVTGYSGTNFARFLTTGQSGASVYSVLTQNIESVRTNAGSTITVSFWAKAASGTPKVFTEVLQSFGTGGSPSASVITAGGQSTLSTSWARYSVTIAVPSISGKTIGTNKDDYLQLNFWVSAGTTFNSRTSSLGIQSNTFDFWGVQVEQGSTATAFQTATGTIGGELALCQRYYWRSSDTSSYANYGTAFAVQTNSLYASVKLPVTMRVRPTSVDYSTLGAHLYNISVAALSSVTLDTSSTSADWGVILGATTGLTQFRPYGLNNNNSTSGYIGFSAEL